MTRQIGSATRPLILSCSMSTPVSTVASCGYLWRTQLRQLVDPDSDGSYEGREEQDEGWRSSDDRCLCTCEPCHTRAEKKTPSQRCELLFDSVLR